MAIQVDEVGALAVIRLHRPERAHAYTAAMLQALDDAAQRLAARHPVLLVESTGDGAFCGGADLSEMSEKGPLDALDLLSQRVFTRLARLPALVVVAVQGAAVAGGFELALAADLRVAGPHARFWLPETRLGLLPSAGGTTRLSRLVGPSRAKAMILGGEVLDATGARDWGLVQRIADDPRAAAREWGIELARRDPAAMRLAKERIDADESDSALAGERVVEAILYGRAPSRRPG